MVCPVKDLLDFARLANYIMLIYLRDIWSEQLQNIAEVRIRMSVIQWFMRC